MKPLEIAGISLTPRVLFWAYKEAVEMWFETHLFRYAILVDKLDRRLDRILQEMEE